MQSTPQPLKSSPKSLMAQIRRSGAIFRALSTTYYAYMLEYRAELLLWALSGAVPFILMGAWVKAAETGQFGLSSIQFAQYYLAAFIARQMNVVWVVWEFEKEVNQGLLSPKLLQPIDPVWHHLVSHLTERFVRLPIIGLLVILFFVLYPQSFWLPSATNLLGFMIITLLAFGLRFLIQYTFAMGAFWMEKAAALEQAWFFIYLLGSGILAPLEVFPPLVRSIVEWTPFPYLIHFPAALLMGLPVDWGKGLLAIGLWSGFFYGLNRWLWRRGLRQYSGMGA